LGTFAYLGRALGLYAALRDEAGLTPAELAGRAGVDERYAREWLEHQAVAGVVAVNEPGAGAADRRYHLPEAHAVALLDEEHPAYAGALADIPPIIGRTLDELVDAFRTGAGIPFAAYGLHDMQAGFTRPMFATSLVGECSRPCSTSRPASAPARHSASPTSAAARAGPLAEAYPNVTVVGYDLDDTSVAAARRHAAGRGVTDRVSFEVRDVTDPELAGGYDLVYACEVIHDLPDPVTALAAMRRLAGAGGAVLVIDERAHEEFAPTGDPVQRLLYGFSVVHCLPAGRDACTSAATGTVCVRPPSAATPLRPASPPSTNCRSTTRPSVLPAAGLAADDEDHDRTTAGERMAGRHPRRRHPAAPVRAQPG
jgi:hypothetical protein